MAETIVCSGCGRSKPATREFFGSNPSGGLRLRCRECVRQQTKAYAAANPERQGERNQTRQDRGGHISLTREQKQELHVLQNGICFCCGERITSIPEAQVDHGTSLAKGGANEHWNLFLAHAQCNKEKHGKTLDEHWKWRRRVGKPSFKAEIMIGLAHAMALSRREALVSASSGKAVYEGEPLSPSCPRPPRSVASPEPGNESQKKCSRTQVDEIVSHFDQQLTALHQKKREVRQELELEAAKLKVRFWPCYAWTTVVLMLVFGLIRPDESFSGLLAVSAMFGLIVAGGGHAWLQERAERASGYKAMVERYRVSMATIDAEVETTVAKKLEMLPND